MEISSTALRHDVAEARKVMAETLGIDAHIDTIQRVMMGEDLGQRHDTGQVDLPRLREGEMHAPFFALWVPVFFQGGAEAVRRTLDLCDAMPSVLDKYKDQIELATTAADIEQIVKAHKISAFLTIEGGHTIDDDVRVPRMYYRLGIRSNRRGQESRARGSRTIFQELSVTALRDFTDAPIVERY